MFRKILDRLSLAWLIVLLILLALTLAAYILAPINILVWLSHHGVPMVINGFPWAVFAIIFGDIPVLILIAAIIGMFVSSRKKSKRKNDEQ